MISHPNRYAAHPVNANANATLCYANAPCYANYYHPLNKSRPNRYAKKQSLSNNLPADASVGSAANEAIGAVVEVAMVRRAGGPVLLGTSAEGRAIGSAAEEARRASTLGHIPGTGGARPLGSSSSRLFGLGRLRLGLLGLWWLGLRWLRRLSARSGDCIADVGVGRAALEGHDAVCVGASEEGTEAGGATAVVEEALRPCAHGGGDALRYTADEAAGAAPGRGNVVLTRARMVGALSDGCGSGTGKSQKSGSNGNGKELHVDGCCD